MSKPLRGLIGILAVGLVIFAALSFVPDGINLGFATLKTGTFAETLFAANNPPVRKTAKAGATRNNKQESATGKVQATKPEHVKKSPMDTTAKTILFIGDSMLEGLGPRLAAYAKENGHTLIDVIWYSSTTEIWGKSTRLKENIATFRPDYIFICLGANELFVSDIKRKRQKYLDNMLSQIGSIPYVWIGPPNWKPDTGINDMLQESCAPGSFYLSNGQHFDRAKDGAHPTHASAAAWCDRVCKWVMTESAHPIRLNKPKAAKGRCKTIVYQPQR